MGHRTIPFSIDIDRSLVKPKLNSKRPRSHDRILGLLDRLPRALSAQEIFVELRQCNQALGLATIYRALEALKLAGFLQVRTQSSGEAFYSSAHQDRHHLTCLQCGDSIPLERCPVHDLEQRLQEMHQFKIYYHTLEFFGLCDQCKLEVVETDSPPATHPKKGSE